MVPSVTIVTGRGFAIGCNYTEIAIVNGEDFPGQQPSFHFFPSETLFALFAQSEYRRFRTYFWLTDLSHKIRHCNRQFLVLRSWSDIYTAAAANKQFTYCFRTQQCILPARTALCRLRLASTSARSSASFRLKQPCVDCN